MSEQQQKLDPELQKIIGKYGIPKPFMPTPDTMPIFRKRWSAGTERFMKTPVAQKALDDASGLGRIEKDIKIPVRDGSTVDARVYIPNNSPPDGLPLMVMFHGGGWCMGGVDTEEFQCRLWCKKLGLVIVNVAYRLCPEHIFPIPPQDAYDSVQWVSVNATKFGGNLIKGFLVGGCSGGATFAAIASHLARDDGMNPPLTGVFLSIPFFSDQTDDGSGKKFLIQSLYKSARENKDAPLLNEAMIERFEELCKADRASPFTCPLLFASHKGLPPLYIQACDVDPFRDGSFIYEGLLRAAGSQTKMDFYPGLPHGFWTAFPQLTATGRWIQDTIDGADWLLKKGRRAQATPHL